MKMSFKSITSAVLAIVMTLSLITCSLAAYKGDLNADGNVNSTDALAILRYAVKLDNEINEKVADLNDDGTVNATDALAILRIAVGLDEKIEMPEEEPGDNPDEEPGENPGESEQPVVPSSKEEIVEFYNTAVNKVVNEKAGYTKQRTTTVLEMNGGALMSMAEGVVKEFLGEGTKDYNNKKGSSKFFLTASLSSADVQSATATISDSGFVTISLNLNNGESVATSKEKTDNSPVAKSGLVTGSVADPDYDYLSSGSIYASVTAEKVKVDSIKAKNTNVKIVAVVDSEGKLVSLTSSYDWTVEMTNVKYSFITVKAADGRAHTAVELSDFEW